MLVLSRKLNEAVVVGSINGLHCLLKVKVLAIRNGSVKLGFETDDDVPVHRSEVWDRITAQEWGIDCPEPLIKQEVIPTRRGPAVRRNRATRATTANRYVTQSIRRDDRLV